MNTQKFKKYFKKIKSLDEWMDNLEELSVIEKDLLKDYIKKLYESVLDIDSNEKKEKKYKKVKHISEKTPETEIILEEPQKEEVIIDNPPVQQIIEPKMKEVIDEPKVTDSENLIEEYDEKDIETYSQALLDLFEFSENNELSHKLSLSPIKSLAKGFSINERIFTVKELFGGNKSDFDKTVSDLDQFNSLDEAKIYILNNVVSKHNWDEDKMIKKVKQFINTVKRRYL